MVERIEEHVVLLGNWNVKQVVFELRRPGNVMIQELTPESVHIAKAPIYEGIKYGRKNKDEQITIFLGKLKWSQISNEKSLVDEVIIIILLSNFLLSGQRVLGYHAE